jgi:hypothetical protein
LVITRKHVARHELIARVVVADDRRARIGESFERLWRDGNEIDNANVYDFGVVHRDHLAKDGALLFPGDVERRTAAAL